tara:strand:+ start:862 stop:1452 length:591 start_codon:yes stop_codon:yes gene_type:complete
MKKMTKLNQKQTNKHPERLLLVGMIGAAHGISGLVRVKSFMTEPTDISNFDLLEDELGNIIKLELTGKRSGGALLSKLKGIESRNAAESMKGKKLYALRSALPNPSSEEWYYADLIGLNVFDRLKKHIGIIQSVVNYGAGDLLEISLTNGELLSIPFTRDLVPNIDINSGKITIIIPSQTTPVGKESSSLELENIE